MKALVVYDSQFGNTAQVAQALGKALGPPEEVQTLRVGEVQPEHLAGLDLLVVGSPTQRFRPTPVTTQFLKDIPRDGLQGVRVAAFDTRITETAIEEAPAVLSFFVKLFGYAAKPIADRLQKKGGDLVAPPEGFYVGGTEGPLLEGELERAARWAREMA
jgi:flavodoxin